MRDIPIYIFQKRRELPECNHQSSNTIHPLYKSLLPRILISVDMAFFKPVLGPIPRTLPWLIRLDIRACISGEAQVMDSGMEMFMSLEVVRPSRHGVGAKDCDEEEVEEDEN